MNQRFQQRLEKARKSDEGFTLIELLIVIVVLGILAGIVVFGVGTFKEDSEDAVACADAKTATVAADAYNAKTGAYPTGTATAMLTELDAKGYLKEVPASTLDWSTDKFTATGVTC